MLYSTINMFRCVQNRDTSRAGLNSKSFLMRMWSFTPDGTEMHETQQFNRKRFQWRTNCLEMCEMTELKN